MFSKTIKDLSILVVEDDVETLSLLDLFLKEKYSKVYSAESYEKAFELFQNKTIDVVITDIKLHNKSGIDLSKEIRKIDSNIPIILVSAMADKEIILEALHVGVNHYLFKPVIYDEFSILLKDVSNKALARKRLEYKNNLLLDAVEHSSEIISILGIDYSIEYINPKFETLLGYSLENIEEKNLKDMISFKKHDEKFYKDLLLHINSKKLYKDNIYLEDIEQNHLLFNITITPNIDENGLVSNYILNGESIDEVTAIKKELEEKTTLYLAQATSMATEDMVKKLAHHWRQPLASFSGVLEIIKMGFELDDIKPDELIKMIDSSLQEVESLSKTIDFFYSKYQNENEKREINLDSFILKSFDFIENYLLQEDITFEFDLNSDEDIFLSKKNIFDILTIIVDNAKDEFIENRSDEKNIKVITYTDKEYAYIEIFNEGKNISEDIRFKIFEPYFSTKHVKSGTGLGLYISKEIIEKLYNGNLYFENKSNGVSFIIKIEKNTKEI